MPGSPTGVKRLINLGDLSLTSSSPIETIQSLNSFEESPSLRAAMKTRAPTTSRSVGAFSSWAGPTGRENVKTNSLTKLQLEKWNLQDQIKTLESQVRSRDVLIQENQQLRDTLTETIAERDSVKHKYVELTHKLAVFLQKEKAERKQVDTEISKTKKECDSIEQERGRILEEKNRLIEEIDSLKEETQRLKELVSQSVDRESFERQKQDILQENAQLRLMLEESIPRCLYQRLEQQLTESVASASLHGASMREMHLDNQRLLGRLNTLEMSDAENAALNQSLQKELRQSQNTLASLREDFRTQQEITKKERDSLEVKHAEDLGTLQDQLRNMRDQFKIAEAQAVSVRMENRLEVSMNQAKDLREAVGKMKVEFLNMKRSIANTVARDLEKVLAFHNRLFKLVSHELNCVMAESGSVVGEGGCRLGFSESLEILRACIAKFRKEIKMRSDDVECLASEVGLLKSTLSEKDTIIDGLVLRLSNFDRAKTRERDALTRLRTSVESAERKLNASRIHD